MTIASVQDLISIGFRAEQFGNPANFALGGGLLQTLLAEKAALVQALVGAAVYADPTVVQRHYLREAERYLCAAELWRRRSVHEDANARVARQQGQGPSYSAEARNADALAWQALDQLGVSQYGGLAVGYVETDPLAVASS